MLFVCSYEDLMFGSDGDSDDDDDETSFSRKVNAFSMDMCCRKKCPESLKATKNPRNFCSKIFQFLKDNPKGIISGCFIVPEII
jgi:hypothetical protein